MPTESKFPRLNIPNVNLWEFLFSNLDRTYPNHQGELCILLGLKDTKPAADESDPTKLSSLIPRPRVPTPTPS